MSAAELQRAIARLIRRPEDFRKADYESFAATFNLNAQERRQLDALKVDPKVVKYGRIMRGARWEGIVRRLKILPEFIDRDLLEEIAYTAFEATAETVRAQYFPIRFLEFLRDDLRARTRLQRAAPPFIFDLVHYEHAQMLFHRQALDTALLPEGRRLAHRCFVVQKFEYDVLASIVSGHPRKNPPTQRPCQVLFLGSLAIPRFRTFEIDAATAAFLEDGAAGPDLPQSYDELVSIGLCRKASSH